ncbi:hypothetical protein [Streptomyces sp. NPDC058548]|uniref:hypothetical protein n=1 Tax=Streptomyces sp. NPDC058548 TaxID=3346545 RepID=UPI0036488A3D
MLNNLSAGSSSPSPSGPFVIVNGQAVPWVPSQGSAGVPAGSTFSPAPAAGPVEGPFVVVDGVAVPISSPGMLGVPSSPVAPVFPYGGTGAVALMPPSGRGLTPPSWQSVVITGIIAAVVVTCMVMGMEIAAIVAALALIIMAVHQVRSSLA